MTLWWAYSPFWVSFDGLSVRTHRSSPQSPWCLNPEMTPVPKKGIWGCGAQPALCKGGKLFCGSASNRVPVRLISGVQSCSGIPGSHTDKIPIYMAWSGWPLQITGFFLLALGKQGSQTFHGLQWHKTTPAQTVDWIQQ